MLSPRARAFTVERLVAKPEPQQELRERLCGNSSLCLQKYDACGSTIQSVYDESGGGEIGVELCQADLWAAFYSLGTEMIITKSGRRMFPAVRVRLLNLIPDRMYRVSLDFRQVDLHKYRYAYHSSKWTVSGAGEHPYPGQKYVHPDCPVSGRYLMDHLVSFEKLKLTNNSDPRHSQVSLVSMQRFVPRLHVELLTSDLGVETHFSTSFQQTCFMAVTAYQNHEITRLKIARNPFAKGFRESRKNRSRLESVMSLQSYFLLPEVAHRKRGLKDPEDLNYLGQPAKVLKSRATTLDVPCQYRPALNCCCSPCVDLPHPAFTSCYCVPLPYMKDKTPCQYQCRSMIAPWRCSYVLPTYECQAPAQCDPMGQTLLDQATDPVSPTRVHVTDSSSLTEEAIWPTKTRVKVERVDEEG